MSITVKAKPKVREEEVSLSPSRPLCPPPLDGSTIRSTFSNTNKNKDSVSKGGLCVRLSKLKKKAISEHFIQIVMQNLVYSVFFY